LQTIAFEQIVSSSWRCKLAIRLEMHRLKSQFRTEEERLSDKPGKVRDIREIRWYGASPDDLNVAIKILQDLQADIASNGAIHLKEKEDTIIRAFGPQFYDALVTWAPMSIDAILLAQQLHEHTRKLTPTPIASGPSAPTAKPAASTSGPTPSSPESRPSIGATKGQHSKVVVDPQQKWQMMLKLVEFQLQHLLDIRRMRRQATLVPQEVHSDFVPRYFASASRDLHRAVDWFIYVKSHEL
jgi:hypothetical protein